MVVNDPSPTDARAIRAYICDSDSSRAGDSEWFTGTITGDTFDLTSASAEYRAKFTNETIIGP